MSAVNGAVPEGGRRHARLAVRTRAWLLGSLALAFYFGFIALTIYRSHH